jgi:hypothetical protein
VFWESFASEQQQQQQQQQKFPQGKAVFSKKV